MKGHDIGQIALEFVFRRQHRLKDLIKLIRKKAKTFSVRSVIETSGGTTYSLSHKKYQGDIYLSESDDGVISGRIVEGDMILGAFVDWIGRNGQDLVYGLDIRFRS